MFQFDKTETCRINTCKRAYVGQLGRAISTRHKEHTNYIRTNNPQSAYTTHILQNRHGYGPSNETLQLLKACNKGSRMNCWEAMFIQRYHRRGELIMEQKLYENNPLFELIHEIDMETSNTVTVQNQFPQQIHQQRKGHIT